VHEVFSQLLIRPKLQVLYSRQGQEKGKGTMNKTVDLIAFLSIQYQSLTLFSSQDRFPKTAFLAICRKT
jgi:hypothetical protein